MNAVTIRTERLLLRPVAPEDWRAMQAIWQDQARSPYARFDKPSDVSDEAVQARIARWAALSGGTEHLFFAVCLAGEPIGYIALNRREGGYELGYCFHSAHHRRGFARESLAALLAAAGQSERALIVARTALENTPSVRLLASLGFEQTGSEDVSFYRDEQGRPIVFRGGVFEKRVG